LLLVSKPNRQLYLHSLLWLATMTASFSGCGSDQPTLVEVTGRVTMRGEPLTAGSIHLTPADTNDFQADQPSSLLELDGSFTIKTFPYGEGVPPGQYQVTLAPALAARIRRPDLADPQKTPWQLDVPPAGIHNHLFEVK
jgi:hypothetical protein